MVILWSVPVGLTALVVGANVALAAGLARLLALLGMAPGGGGAGIGFWALFFGSLALANGPALAAFAAWSRAQERDWALRAEVLSALRWPAQLTAGGPNSGPACLRLAPCPPRRRWPPARPSPATCPMPPGLCLRWPGQWRWSACWPVADLAMRSEFGARLVGE